MRAARVEHRTTIMAPAESIWKVIADIDGWSRWSVLYPKATGALRPGEQLDLLIALPGLKPQVVRPKVTAAVPNRCMEYASSSLGGLSRARRYIVIEPVGGDRCEVANGEEFSGILGRLIARLLRGRITAGFAAMNDGLKAAAEGQP